MAAPPFPPTSAGDAPEVELIPPSRQYTLEELKQNDGTGPDGTILVGLNGKVYDVTAGKNFYGSGKYSARWLFLAAARLRAVICSRQARLKDVVMTRMTAITVSDLMELSDFDLYLSWPSVDRLYYNNVSSHTIYVYEATWQHDTLRLNTFF